MFRPEEISASVRLLRRGTTLAIAVAITVGVLALLDDTSNDYSARAAEKHARIQSLPSPKIVFVGGSNAAFGIDSYLIEKQLGRPVVNMALSADVGLPFMLKEVEPFMLRDDLLIVTPEYELFYQGALGDQARYRTASFLPRPFTYMTSTPDAVNFVLAVVVERAQVTVQKTIRHILGREVEEPVYSRRAFNELGDVVAHLSAVRHFDTAGWNSDSSADIAINDHTFEALHSFAIRMTREGVRVVLIPPAILDLQYQRDERNIDRVFSRISLQAMDRSYLVLGAPAGFAFPARDMYDTHYHLNREGRAIRTRRILELLTRSESVR